MQILNNPICLLQQTYEFVLAFANVQESISLRQSSSNHNYNLLLEKQLMLTKKSFFIVIYFLSFNDISNLHYFPDNDIITI